MSAPDFYEIVSEHIEDDVAHVKTQDDLTLWLELVRKLAWDIPSALSSLCSHELWPGFDWGYFMHKGDSQFDDGDWGRIENHFQSAHNWDLSDPHINWSFDT